MDKGARKRWTLLMGVLILTIAAIFYPTDEESEATTRPGAPAPRAAAAPAPAAAGAAPALVAAAIGADEPETDPFAPRGWQPPPPPPPPTQTVAKVVVQEEIGPQRPPPPPPPPPLPFKFVGSMNDNADQVVYLGRGDQALLARVGVTLEGTYKVLAINTRQIEFQHIPSGQKQTLVFPVRDN